MALLSDRSLSLAVGGSELVVSEGFNYEVLALVGNFIQALGKFHTIAWEVLRCRSIRLFGECCWLL